MVDIVINEFFKLKNKHSLFRSKYIPKIELADRLNKLIELKSEFDKLGLEERIIFKEDKINLFKEYTENIKNLSELYPGHHWTEHRGGIMFIPKTQRGKLTFSFYNGDIPYYLDIMVSNLPKEIYEDTFFSEDRYPYKVSKKVKKLLCEIEFLTHNKILADKTRDLLKKL